MVVFVSLDRHCLNCPASLCCVQMFLLAETLATFVKHFFLTRVKESSAMQRCAKDQPETHHLCRHGLPPLLLLQTASHCKSSWSIQSRRLVSTQRKLEINGLLGNIYITSGGRLVMPEQEAQGWRHGSTRGTNGFPCRGEADTVERSKTFPPLHQNNLKYDLRP